MCNGSVQQICPKKEIVVDIADDISPGAMYYSVNGRQMKNIRSSSAMEKLSKLNCDAANLATVIMANPSLFLNELNVMDIRSRATDLCNCVAAIMQHIYTEPDKYRSCLEQVVYDMGGMQGTLNENRPQAIDATSDSFQNYILGPMLRHV